MISMLDVLGVVRSGVTPSQSDVQSSTDLHLNITFSTILLVIHGKMLCQCFFVKTSPFQLRPHYYIYFAQRKLED